MTEPAAMTIPSQLGQYLLLAKLGKGGMGTVYKAMHSHLKRVVAIKVLPPERLHEHQAVSRFYREMEAVGKLDHPNIIRATDAGTADGQHFLVMEFAEGLDLAKLVRLTGPLAVADACELVRQSAVGLQYIHEHGLVHRDLKPSNLLLTLAGQVKVLDLGLARLYGAPSAGEELTPSGVVMGTADYMAPEQGTDSREVDIRSDIYSLGCTLYKLLSGQPPFGGPEWDSFLKKLMAHAHKPVPPIRDRRADVPAGVAAVLDRMLAKDPAERFTEPAALAEALAPFSPGSDLPALAEKAVAKDVPSAPDGPASGAVETGLNERQTRPLVGSAAAPRTLSAPSFRRRRIAWLALISLALAGLVGGVIVILMSVPEPEPPAPGPPAVVKERPAEMIPGQWHNLLAEPPAELLWGKNETRPVFDGKRQELLVASSQLGLLALGQTVQAGYKFQVMIRQNQWAGGVGIFFGYHEAQCQGMPCLRYQAILLIPEARKASLPFRLVREQGTIRTDKFGRRVSPKTTVAGQALPRPDHPDQALEVHVSTHGILVEVRWGNEVIPALTSPQANGFFTPDDYRGAFGIVTAAGMASFRDARFYLFERDNP